MHLLPPVHVMHAVYCTMPCMCCLHCKGSVADDSDKERLRGSDEGGDGDDTGDDDGNGNGDGGDAGGGDGWGGMASHCNRISPIIQPSADSACHEGHDSRSSSPLLIITTKHGVPVVYIWHRR